MLPERPTPQPLTEAEALLLSQLATKLETYMASRTVKPAQAAPVENAAYCACIFLTELASTLPYVCGTKLNSVNGTAPTEPGVLRGEAAEMLAHVLPFVEANGCFRFQTWNGGYAMAPEAASTGWFTLGEVWFER